MIAQIIIIILSFCYMILSPLSFESQEISSTKERKNGLKSDVALNTPRDPQAEKSRSRSHALHNFRSK